MLTILLQPAAATGTALTAVINESAAFTFNKKAFGVHGELLFSRIKIDSAELATRLADMGVQYIRVMGGTTMNWYLPLTGNFGNNNPITPNLESSDLIDDFNTSLTFRGPYGTAELVAMIANTGLPITLVVDVLSDTPANTRLWMDNIAAAGVTLTDVELGNELYASRYDYGTPTPYDYISQANKHAHEVRAVFPSTELTYLGSPAPFDTLQWPDLAAAQNSAVVRHRLQFDQLAAAAPLSAGIASHFYAKPGSELTDTVLNEPNTYERTVAYFKGKFHAAADWYQEIAPTKNLRLTEWGVAFPRGYERDGEDAYHDKCYQGLYLAQGLCEIFTKPNIDAAAIQNITSFWVNVTGTTYPVKPGYKIMQFFKDPVAAAVNVAAVDLTGSLLHTSAHPDYTGDVEEVTAVYLAAASGGSLIVVNNFDNTYELGSILADAASTARTSMTQLVPDAGGPSSTGWTETTASLTANEAVTIPAYSVTEILVGAV